MSPMHHRLTRPAVALVSLTLIALLSSCGSKKEADEAAPPTTTTSSEPAAALTDANIAAIVVAANSIDIKNAQLAETKSHNGAVKAFALQMITDHTSVNVKAVALATKLGVTPEENDTSRQLVASADSTRAAIEGQPDAAFDAAYIGNEVAYHQAVIDMLDNTLIPGATNAELKAMLVDVKPAFQAHLDHAKKVQAALGH